MAATFRPSMGRRQRSTTGTIAGLKRRVWQRIFEKMAASPSPIPDELSIDSCYRGKAHRSASGSKRGEFEEALIGRSRERKDEQNSCHGRRSRQTGCFRADPGNVADIAGHSASRALVAKPKRVLADKVYDADSLRRWLEHRKITAAIPSTASRRTPYPLDRAAYKRRNVIERLFCKLQNWRRVAKLSLGSCSRCYNHRLDLNESPT